ncbi:MAG: VOC family protein [Candidatus Heimdallarchaeota archaeon]|nr:VOC family protein [Candidatus Heimdallarchaeota archaeon]
MKSYVDHIEIPVVDLNNAKEFYKAIFEWTDDMFSNMGENYVLVSSGNGVSYGLEKVDTIPPTGFTIVMRVESIEESLEMVKNHGGEVVKEKFQIAPNIGFAAYFKDCFGNTWGIHCPT